MSEVEPRLLERGYCQCGDDRCQGNEPGNPIYGLLGRPDRGGRRHAKGCPCGRCRGRRNRAKGDRKAAKARKALGIAGANTRHEELWGGPLRIESKAGAQVKPIWTRYQAARAQSEVARPIGDNRPFVFTASPDGTSEQLFVVSSTDWDQVCHAYVQWLADGGAA